MLKSYFSLKNCAVYYERVVRLKWEGVTVMIMFGGWGESTAKLMSYMARDPAARDNFTRSTVEFVEKYGFDGVELAWMYPVCWKVSGTQRTPTQSRYVSGTHVSHREEHQVT